jgi:hypothetical protein
VGPLDSGKEQSPAGCAGNDGQYFEAGLPATLFQTRQHQAISVFPASYDVTADGQRFLVNTKVEKPNEPHLEVVLNWTSEMEK